MKSPEFRFYYFTSQYEKTVDFYRDVLNFEIYRSWDQGEGSRGTIFQSPNGVGFIEIEEGNQLPSIQGGFYIEINGIDKLYETLKKRGAVIIKQLGITSYGHRNFKIVDPNGIEVFFFEYLVQSQDVTDA